jgi:epoxyqueuosine reductase
MVLRASLPTIEGAKPDFTGFTEEARRLGFMAAGFSSPDRPPFFDHFRAWIEKGKNADMVWLRRHMALRGNPGLLLEGCRTVISLVYPYPLEKPCTPEGFFAARYAQPTQLDYHKRLRELAQPLVSAIMKGYPGSKTKVCIDSAPILERSFAYASGVGFIGKNNMLIVPGSGSYLYLMEILSTAEIHFRPSEPMMNRCASCTQCLDACPTGALEAPFSFDASLCLSYLTIEYRGALNRKTGRKMGRCFFGCDVCQEVCPFNGEGSGRDISLPSLEEILGMGKRGFRERFGRTAFARAGFERLKRNIEAILPNAD